MSVRKWHFALTSLTAGGLYHRHHFATSTSVTNWAPQICDEPLLMSSEGFDWTSTKKTPFNGAATLGLSQSTIMSCRIRTEIHHKATTRTCLYYARRPVTQQKRWPLHKHESVFCGVHLWISIYLISKHYNEHDNLGVCAIIGTTAGRTDIATSRCWACHVEYNMEHFLLCLEIYN